MEEALVKRIMPHSLEAEQSVIGSMIMDRDAILTASEQLVKDDFYHQQYGILFETITELFNSGAPVDLITLQNRLREKNVPPEISSLEYVGDLVTTVPTSANVKYYAEIVKEKAVLRKLIKINEQIADTCYLGNESLEVILEETEKSIFNLLQSRSNSDYVPIKQVVLNALDKIELASRTQGNVTGIPTGFVDLDYKLSGLQPSDMILVAARPSMGKTAFVLNIVQNVGTKQNKAVAVFSLEMGAESLVDRMLAAEGMIDSHALRTGQLTEQDWNNVMIAQGALAEAPIYIDDTPGIKITEIRARSRKLSQEVEGGLGLIVIDYLQLITGTRPENRQQEVSDISRQLKILAKELKVPVIALSQLSRGVEQRQDKRPVLSDIRESGSIEQDADIVAFLYRDDYYRKESEESENAIEDNTIEVILEKNRAGARGTVKLLFQKEYNKFSSIAQFEES